MNQLVIRLAPPLIMALASLVAWELLVHLARIPPYLLPSPRLIARTLWDDRQLLALGLQTTGTITMAALALSVVTGYLFAALIVQIPWLERALLPYTIVLQTTPIVAVAPLLLIWLKNDTFLALVACAWLSAVFPIVSNTVAGLKSVEPGLRRVFRLYGANRWQTFVKLQIPSSLPFFLGGLRVSAGLALIGAVAAEFVAGTGGARAGLAYQILMAGYNLQIPRVFAALGVVAGFGVALFTAVSLLSALLLRHWHASHLDKNEDA